MKKSAKIVDLQLLAISALSLANTRKLSSNSITELYNFSHTVKSLIEPISDELDNLKAAEEPIVDAIKQKVFEEIKTDNADEINSAYAIKAARNSELSSIIKRKADLLGTKKDIEFTPIQISVSEEFISELPKESVVKFNGTISHTNPLESYFDLINEGIIVVNETKQKKAKA